MTASLFAYGTLEIPAVMQAVTGRDFPSAEAVLEGFARYRLKGRAYPGIVANAGAQTRGRVYRSVDRLSLELLDRFEGKLFERRLISVRTLEGTALCAYTYAVRERHHALLSRESWDRDRFAARHLRRYLASCWAFRVAERRRVGPETERGAAQRRVRSRRPAGEGRRP